MKLVTSQEMRRIDEVTIRERGVSGSELMDRAGRAVAREVMERFRPQSVAIVAGKGNNGGDGFVAARALHDLGVKAVVYSLYEPGQIRGEALEAFNKLPAQVPVQIPKRAHELRGNLIQYDVVIDAILGTGLKGPVTGFLAEVIDEINSCQTSVVSIDIPSGLLAGIDQSGGPCVRASITVTIGLPKVGLVLGAGERCAGLVSIADIGFPRDLLDDPRISVNLLTVEEMRASLPRRDPAGHKGTFGKVLILAGSEGMTGAAVLCARAAMRSGAGLVYSGYPRALGTIMESHLIEPVKRPFTGREPWFVKNQGRAALKEAGTVGAVALGPGIGTRPATSAFVQEIVRGVNVPLVIDADGLNALAAMPKRGGWKLLERRAAPTILTPHPGEVARLLGSTIEAVQSDRLNACLELSRACRAVVILKGAKTVITDPGGQRYLNPSGNSGLAKGGSGDVLTGLIVGLLAQGMTPVGAAQLGVFLHGVAADRAAERIGVRALTPSDVIDHLGKAFLNVERGTES